MGVLTGLKVIDLTRVLAGPYCSMLLADMGADVIKIEVPQTGDDSRAFVPKLNGESAYFMNLNRNKRSITLNLKSVKGKELFLNLIDRADIILENFRPGTMERLGLGYDVLSKRNPRIIYGCVSGFGHYGPYSDRPGYDIISQAMGGLMSTTGWPGGQPTRSGTAIGDVLGGLNCCIGVLAAYIKSKSTGLGQKVDVALVDSVVSALEIINQIYLTTGRIPERIGNRYEASYPYDSFEASDGLLVIGAGNDKLFANLCKTMEMPELVTDERFITNEKRVLHHEQLKQIIEKWLASMTKAAAVEMILAGGCPAAPIYNIAEVVADEHITGSREMFVSVQHPVAGETTIAGNQIKFSHDKIRIEHPAPLLGQHTHEVLIEILGLTKEEIEAYEKNGVL